MERNDRPFSDSRVLQLRSRRPGDRVEVVAAPHGVGSARPFGSCPGSAALGEASTRNTWPGWMTERNERPFSDSRVLSSDPVARAIA